MSSYFGDASIKENRFFVYLVCIYIVTWYLQLGSRIGILNTIRFEFFLGSFLTVFGAIKLFSGSTVSSSSALRAPIVSWILILGVYTVFSVDRSTSWDVYFNRVIKFSLLAFFLAVYIKTDWSLRMVTLAFLLAMAKLGQEGLVGWLTGGLVWENQGIMRLHGATELYRHPNSFSGMAVGCLPFIFYLYPVVGRWQKILLAFLLLCSVIIIVFTGSRTGYVASVILMVVFFWAQLKKSFIKASITLVFCFSFAIAFLPSQYIDRFKSIYTMEEAEGASASARIQILSDAWGVFKQYPFGVGVGAFPIARAEIYDRHQDTHNLYLQLLTNTSLFGVVVFFWLLLAIVKSCWKVANSSSIENPFYKALSRAVIAFILARLFLGLFGMDAYEIYWWWASGLTIAIMNAANCQIKTI